MLQTMTSCIMSFEALPSGRLLRTSYAMTTGSKRKCNELEDTSHVSKVSGARMHPFPCDSVRRPAKRRREQLPRTAGTALLDTLMHIMCV